MPSFSANFPLMAWLVGRPGWSLAGCAAISLVMLPYSLVWALAPFCFWTLLASLWLEKSLLESLLFPPFTSTVFLPSLGTALGLPLLGLLYEKPESWEAFPSLQIAHLVFFPFAWAGYWVGGFRKMVPPRPLVMKQTLACPSLVPAAWMCLTLAVAAYVIRVLIGWEGRGAELPSLKPWKNFPVEPGKLLNLFPSLVDATFFFVAVLWKRSAWTGRASLLVLLGVYFLTSMTTGARGDLIYPALIIFAGIYFFREKDGCRYEWLSLGLFAVALLVAYAGLNLRSYYHDQNVKSQNIAERLRSATDLLRQPAIREQRVTLTSWASSLYPYFDARIFKFTPEKIPYAGWAGWQAILWTPVPHLIWPNKPPLLDMEKIYYDYCTPAQLQYHAERNEPVGLGSVISSQADAYRRFGWWGIPPTLFVIYLLYGALVHWMLSLGTGTSLWRWWLVALTPTFFKAKPMISLLGTWWCYIYFWPKQLIFLGLFCWIFPKLLGNWKKMQSAWGRRGSPPGPSGPNPIR